MEPNKHGLKTFKFKVKLTPKPIEFEIEPLAVSLSAAERAVKSAINADMKDTVIFPFDCEMVEIVEPICRMCFQREPEVAYRDVSICLPCYEQEVKREDSR